MAPNNADKENCGPNLSAVEEGIPATTKCSPNIPKPATQRSLSLVSKQYDVDGDGKLNPTEQAMRNMDKEGLGYLPNHKVYSLFEEQLRMQKQLLFAKRVIVGCAVLLIILAAANVGVSFAAARLAKDTTTENNVLIVKDTGEIVATNNHGYVFGVTTGTENASERRSTQAVGDGSTSATQVTTISRSDAQAMLADCQSGGTAHIARTWAGWESVAALNVNIPVCPGNGFTGYAGGDNFKFTMSDSREIEIACDGTNPCTMTGTGVQQLAGDACVYDSDCTYQGTCVGVDAATNTPGTCILPMDASGCRVQNGGSDCETNFCFTGGFTPQTFGYCSCNPTTEEGCTAPQQCYTGAEQGYPDSGPRCVAPVGSACSGDWDCLGATVSCVNSICT